MANTTKKALLMQHTQNFLLNASASALMPRDGLDAARPRMI